DLPIWGKDQRAETHSSPYLQLIAQRPGQYRNHDQKIPLRQLNRPRLAMVKLPELHQASYRSYRPNVARLWPSQRRVLPFSTLQRPFHWWVGAVLDQGFGFSQRSKSRPQGVTSIRTLLQKSVCQSEIATSAIRWKAME